MGQTLQQRSRLLRFAVLVLILLAVLAAVGQVFYWINLSRAESNREWNLRFMQLALLGAVNLIFTACLATMLALYVWSRTSRSLPDLKSWHLEMPKSEFHAGDATDDYSLDDYLEQENRVFAELDSYLTGSWATQSAGDYSRFNPKSICNPATILDRNWNRTHVMKAENPVGGVLLLHGLSDSPYSLRAMGQRLLAEGYTVIWLRVPGHGTNPRALAEVTCEDWTSAVCVAMKSLRKMVPSELPLILAGYSNGGALSLHYTLSAINDSSLPTVDAIILFSPMIGISPLARMTRLYHAVGLFSSGQKANWSSIYAEIDPFKYSSWPMNANVQAWSVTKAVERRLAALEKSGRLAQLPPMLAMQSVVDSTVVVSKLITVLFDRLTTQSSELFLFDVNRADSLCNLLNLSFEHTVKSALSRTDRPFRLTVLRTSQPNSGALSLMIRDQGELTEQPVDLSWPTGVVSLSHVAVPFPTDDPVYGDHSDAYGFTLGNASMRAEPSALMIPSSVFVRCRHNPFYRFMEDRVINWLSENVNR